MNLSLDYDYTYTCDPELWDMFIVNAKARGHKVYCVSLRTPEQGKRVREQLEGKVDGILFTSGKNKEVFCFHAGVSIDVWIDDLPLFILEDARKELENGED